MVTSHDYHELLMHQGRVQKHYKNITNLITLQLQHLHCENNALQLQTPLDAW